MADEQDSNSTANSEEASTPLSAEQSSDALDANEQSSSIVYGDNQDKRWWRRYWQWLYIHKKLSLPGLVIAILLLLALIPVSRFALAGLVLRQSFTIQVVENGSRKPVSSAIVSFDGQSLKTDSQGKVHVSSRVGRRPIDVSKKYYAGTNTSVLVPILKQRQVEQIAIKAIGRQVPVVILDKVSHKPVQNAVLSASGVDVKTDAKGQAVIVLPADKNKVDARLSAKGYLTTSPIITVTTESVASNSFMLVPSGSVYFLSNKSGTVDVVKSNLDGSDRKVVLAGTGKEQYDTRIVASYDWRYIALLSRRDGGNNSKLFVLDTSNDALATIDTNPAAYTLVGWSGHSLAYMTDLDADITTPKKQAIKSFDANTKKVTTIDETNASADAPVFYETFSSPAIIDKEVVYARDTYTYGDTVPGLQAALIAAKADGSGKHTVKSWDSPIGQFVSTAQGGVDELWFGISSDIDEHLYAYKSGKFRIVSDKSANDVYSMNPMAYALSPSLDKASWSASRDGKSVFFVDALPTAEGKQIAELNGGFRVYGWYTDQYILIAKDSELYIMSATSSPSHQPLKISGYDNVDGDVRLAYGNGGI